MRHQDSLPQDGHCEKSVKSLKYSNSKLLFKFLAHIDKTLLRKSNFTLQIFIIIIISEQIFYI